MESSTVFDEIENQGFAHLDPNRFESRAANKQFYLEVQSVTKILTKQTRTRIAQNPADRLHDQPSTPQPRINNNTPSSPTLHLPPFPI